MLLPKSNQRIRDAEIHTLHDDECACILEHDVHDVEFEGCHFFGFLDSKNKKPKAAVLINGDRTTGLPTGVPQRGNISFRKCVFWNWSTGIHNNDSTRCIVEDCEFYEIVGTESGFGYGITSFGALCSFRNNIIQAEHGQGRHGIYVHYSQNVDILNNRIWNFRSAGIALNTKRSDLENINVIGNTLINCCNSPQYSEDAAIGIWRMAPGMLAGSNIRFTNNSMLGCSKTAFFASGVYNLIVNGNLFESFCQQKSDHAVIFKNCPFAEFKENILYSPNQAAIGLELICCEKVEALNNRYRMLNRVADIRNNATAPIGSSIVNNWRELIIANEQYTTKI